MIRKFTASIFILFFIFVAPLYALTDGYYQIYDQGVYQVDAEYRLINIGDNTASDITLNLALLNHHLTRQSRYSSILKASTIPAPENIFIDEKGNNIGIYQIQQLQAGEVFSIRITYVFKVAKANYKIDPNSIGEYITVIRGLSPFLKPSPKIESKDPLIISKAKELTANEPDPYNNVKKIFEFIQQHMKYAENEGDPRNKGALSALKTGIGVCEDYADLMVALLRASGIPARTVSGWMGYVGQKPVKIAENGQTIKPGHIWLEYYLPNYGWIPCDPTYSYIVNDKPGVDYSRMAGIKELRYSDYSEIPNSSILYSFRGGNVDVEFDMTIQRIDDMYSNQLDGEQICLYYEDLPLIFDVNPININNRVLVPLRGVFNVLGARVDYLAQTRQVMIKSKMKDIVLSIDDIKALVDGQEVELDTEPRIIDGRALIPLRFVAETMGNKVSWDGQKRTINLYN